MHMSKCQSWPIRLPTKCYLYNFCDQNCQSVFRDKKVFHINSCFNTRLVAHDYYKHAVHIRQSYFVEFIRQGI